MSKLSIDFLKQKKFLFQKITCLTAYDTPIASLIDSVGIDIILVGDSVGNVVLGHESTRKVTIDDMRHHLAAVKNGVKNSLIVCDLPLSSLSSEANAFLDAVSLFETGADAVKIEGIEYDTLIKKLVDNNFSVMGHIGFTPQTQEVPCIRGKEENEFNLLLESAKKLEDLGVFSIVLELVDRQAAKVITNSLEIPTIGIGSGPYCDGQVLVIHDLIGLTIGKIPKFVKQYANVKEVILNAIKEFKTDVETGKFPQ